MRYGVVGVVGLVSLEDWVCEESCVGPVGWVSDGDSFLFKSMTVEEKVRSLERTARPSEVNIKMIAAATVTLLRNVPGPRLPNTVWLDPPKAAPISAPLPA
jgi:hypothetical protein